jgi:hypothetical protein
MPRMDLRNHTIGDAEIGSNVVLSFAHCGPAADFAHILLGQFGAVIALTLEHAMISDKTAFPAGIGKVLGLGATKQVLWVAARRKVACVTSALISRQGASLRQFQCDAMRRGLLAARAAHAKHAISTGRRGTRPGPAGIRAARAINMFPEALGQCLARFGDALLPADSATKSLGLAAAPMTCELRSADRAGTLREHRNLLCGVTPSAVISSAGAFACLNYSIGKG